ncbi:MAG: hypothetical protein AB7S26_08655 [Sandaracinaceae bacterium]
MKPSPEPTLLPFACALTGALAAVACTNAHTSDRPTVMDCQTAVTNGLQRDPCTFEDECGIADGATWRSAVCDNGSLLTATIETQSSTATACEGTLVSSAGVQVAFTPSERGCVDVTVCNATTSELVTAHLCQVGYGASVAGASWSDCAMAAASGDDGDACEGSFACVADRAIGGGSIIEVVAFCDAGILRLAPSQTLLYGPP